MSLPLADEPWRLSESQIGLFGIAGLAGALGAAARDGGADAGRAVPVTGLSLALLIGSWAVIGQLPRSLWLLAVGIVLLDFAVQAVHVSNQHLLTSAYPDRLSSVIGSYMVFYSLGSALGAAATTAVFTAHGWAGSSLLGAGFAACALAVWAVDRRLPAGGTGARTGQADTRPVREEARPADQAGQVACDRAPGGRRAAGLGQVASRLTPSHTQIALFMLCSALPSVRPVAGGEGRPAHHAGTAVT